MNRADFEVEYFTLPRQRRILSAQRKQRVHERARGAKKRRGRGHNIVGPLFTPDFIRATNHRRRDEMQKFLRQDEVIERTRLSRTSVWRLERAGTFPKRRQIIGSKICWIESEIDEWIQGRPVVDPDPAASAPKGP